MFSADSTQVSTGTPTQGVPYVWGQNFGYVLGILNPVDYGGTSSQKVGTTPVGIYGIATANYNSGYNQRTLYVIKQDGSFWAAGNNADGQFGNSTRNQYNTTTELELKKVRTDSTWALVAGSRSNMATKTDGTLWTCGQNNSGCLGVGNGIVRSSPVQVGALTNWPTSDPKKIAWGIDSMYAIKTDGTLWGWGYNGYGNLGQSNTISRSSPVQITAATNWTKVSSGTGHVLAVRADGTLWAWGDNSQGQLGTGDVVSKSSPVQIGSGTTWSTVCCNNQSSAAVKTDGTLWTWGNNGNGGLGLGNITPKSSPTQVGSLTTWADAYAGFYNIDCLVFKKTDGTLWYSGYSTVNTTGNTMWGPIVSSPVQVGSFTDATGVALGGADTYADGAGWGLAVRSTTGGNLGFSTTGSGTRYKNVATAPIPILFSTATNWKQISLNEYGGMGIKSDGTLWSWGINDNGQVGDGTVVNVSSPIQIGALTTWANLYSNSLSSAAIKTDGTLWTWGSNNQGQLGQSINFAISRSSPVQVGALTTWKQVAGQSDGSTSTSFAAIKTDGTLWTWGANANGQLAQGNIIYRSSPVQVGALTNWKSVAMGYAFGVAVKTDGTLWAWGINTYGQLGQSNTTTTSSPVQIGSVTTWSSVACAYGSFWAVRTDGTLWACGYNGDGELGIGTVANASAVVQVGALTTWAGVGSGAYTLIAYKTDGTLWGAGMYPGDGSAYRSSPVQVSSGATGGTTSWFGLANENAVNTNLGALKS